MSNEIETGSWELEDNLDVEHITSEMSPDLYDLLTWHAIRAAIDVSETKEQVLKMVMSWNNRNDPKLREKSLAKKVLWALKVWDTKFSSSP